MPIPQDYSTKLFHKTIPQDYSTRLFHKTIPQDYLDVGKFSLYRLGKVYNMVPPLINLNIILLTIYGTRSF
ncbi:hypothetical protein CAL7716_038570 [Calothrix sp. PCC 7716]|nr:hypothetical protein CAL7716_038570 [Calothrix sp. PCC 7716]